MLSIWLWFIIYVSLSVLQLQYRKTCSLKTKKCEEMGRHKCNFHKHKLKSSEEKLSKQTRLESCRKLLYLSRPLFGTYYEIHPYRLVPRLTSRWSTFLTNAVGEKKRRRRRRLATSAAESGLQVTAPAILCVLQDGWKHQQDGSILAQVRTSFFFCT